MTGIIELHRDYFKDNQTLFFTNDEYKVTLFRYPSGVEAIEVANSRGKMTVLPFQGQIIWDLEFDGIDLKMKNMFSQPKKATEIVDTYGCFAFHSGLLANGCPSPEDDHVLHGEMACATMDRAWLAIEDNRLTIGGEYEYVKGFGHHYLAKPTVSLASGDTHIEIGMDVKNLAGAEMPLQYMCHTNYAYLANARMTQSIPDKAFQLRKSVPDHVKPTKKWLAFNEELLKSEGTLTTLDQPDMYDPEIVFFADHLEHYGKNVTFEMEGLEGTAFFTTFSTEEFPYATRWLLFNEDQQVASFVLPGTSRPEGFLAAEKAGSLVKLAAGESRVFKVMTGLK
ncbi:aldose 1-epimerase family protein [Bacillus testis]|uniref:aldose 1-epimerase family protein n=1 Tax=Bacillus testis TaxID=1622072 RepID=UPI00067EE543|nr:aldose 1-epimerase family protein [Bacillus testis]